MLDDVLGGKPPAIRRKYPRGGVRHDSGADYYFHVHGGMAREYGHVHLFLRPIGMPASVVPVVPPRRSRRTQGRGEAHLLAISIDRRGLPIGVFTTPWSFYEATAVCAMLDRFITGLAEPTRMNRWLAAVLRLYRDDIEDVVRRRDVALARWRRRYPGHDPALSVQIVTRRRLALAARISEVLRG